MSSQPWIDIGSGKVMMTADYCCPGCNLNSRANTVYYTPHEPDSDECKNIRLHVICHKHPYGEHITLRCTKCHLVDYSTKNIDHIGARSIFCNHSSGNQYEWGCKCESEHNAWYEHVCENK